LRKSRFLHFGDRQTDRLTNKQMDSPNALSCSRCRERRLNNTQQTTSGQRSCVPPFAAQVKDDRRVRCKTLGLHRKLWTRVCSLRAVTVSRFIAHTDALHVAETDSDDETVDSEKIRRQRYRLQRMLPTPARCVRGVSLAWRWSRQDTRVLLGMWRRRCSHGDE